MTRKPFLLLLLLVLVLPASPQSGSKDFSFIFVPHPRSDSRQVQTVLPSISKIDFSLYHMTLLGGDLTYYTSINRVSMDYLDSLFQLGSPNTLWTFGNHDLNNRSLIAEYTGRPSWYTCNRAGITFLVMDTEWDANGFVSSFISGNQLEMFRNVCDTLNHASWLILLHHRLLWMIGNPDFATRIDSVGESTRQLDTTNFYQDIYPLLQQVKKKGIRVLCLGGDKSKINIRYSPEDSIYFLASTMGPEFADSVNHVVILNYDSISGDLQWKYVSLAEVQKKTVVAVPGIPKKNDQPQYLKIPGTLQGLLQIPLSWKGEVSVGLTDIQGRLIEMKQGIPGQEVQFLFPSPGIYFLTAHTTINYWSRKIVTP